MFLSCLAVEHRSRPTDPSQSEYRFFFDTGNASIDLPQCIPKPEGYSKGVIEGGRTIIQMAAMRSPTDTAGTGGNTPFLSGQLETKPTFSQGSDGLGCHPWLQRGAHPLRSRQMASSRSRNPRPAAVLLCGARSNYVTE